MIALIAAYSANRVIGKNGRIPWFIENEKKRFKELTTGNVVIMGRRTYEEIGKPLPGRMTVVLSKTRNFDADNCITAESLDSALEITKGKNVFISGGSGVYEAALPIVEKMYITEIDAVIEGDTYFPEFDSSRFIRTVDAEIDGKIPYKYVTYTRINNCMSLEIENK